MADLQAMVTQQRDALAKETDSRKSLASALAKETDNIKSLASALAEETDSRKLLTSALAKETALRIAETKMLEEQLENHKDEHDQLMKDIQSKQGMLTKEMSENSASLKSISELTLRLIPLHLRVLLDRTRERILVIMEFDSWDDLVKGQSVEQVTISIIRALTKAGIQQSPPHDAIRYLCSYNNVRKAGNYHAHNATREEVRDAVLTKELDSWDRTALSYFFQFVFGESI